MRIFFLFLFFPVLIFSCGTGEDHGNAAPATGEAPLPEPDGAELVHTAFPSLFTFLSRQDTSFSAEKFTLKEGGVIDSLHSLPLNEAQLRPFLPYLIYSPDSLKAIDLFSYNYVPVPEEGKTTIQAGSPDAEVALVDFKTKSRKRLLFSGPSVVYTDARWLNGDQLLLAGAEETASGKMVPRVWKFTLSRNSVDVYTYPSPVTARLDLYVQQKLNP